MRPFKAEIRCFDIAGDIAQFWRYNRVREQAWWDAYVETTMTVEETTEMLALLRSKMHVMRPLPDGPSGDAVREMPLESWHLDLSYLDLDFETLVITGDRPRPGASWYFPDEQGWLDCASISATAAFIGFLRGQATAPHRERFTEY